MRILNKKNSLNNNIDKSYFKEISSFIIFGFFFYSFTFELHPSPTLSKYLDIAVAM